MVKNKEEGVPYSIIGNGIMVADAEDVRKYANTNLINAMNILTNNENYKLQTRLQLIS